jgi:hypothetical protein
MSTRDNATHLLEDENNRFRRNNDSYRVIRSFSQVSEPSVPTSSQSTISALVAENQRDEPTEAAFGLAVEAQNCFNRLPAVSWSDFRLAQHYSGFGSLSEVTLVSVKRGR